eukprot:m.57258 g.57258  ORF g.57258 m.57258 type:complete len:244 (-) comp7066_c0_seq1:112-843(-)
MALKRRICRGSWLGLSLHPSKIMLQFLIPALALVCGSGGLQDCLKQYVFDRDSGRLTAAGEVIVGGNGKAHGPRYFEFHPRLNVIYVVNELSSMIQVYEVDQAAVESLSPDRPVPSLRLIQTISTIPLAFPCELNTCGRITVDPSGEYILVSNRGHDSIAVFKIDLASALVSVVGQFHTRGKTPRHFQFDPTGKFLIVANQDTDSITVFRFEQGILSFTGNVYDVPSPNFVCAVAPVANEAHL